MRGSLPRANGARHRIRSGAWVAALGPSAAAADASGLPTDLSGSYLAQLVLALGVVIAAILVCAWLARRLLRFSPGASADLRVVAGASLGAREKIMLVQAGDTQILVGVSPGRVQVLHVLERPVVTAGTAAAAGAASVGFAARLAALGASRAGPEEPPPPSEPGADGAPRRTGREG